LTGIALKAIRSTLLNIHLDYNNNADVRVIPAAGGRQRALNLRRELYVQTQLTNSLVPNGSLVQNSANSCL
jgi:hypothetical protein